MASNASSSTSSMADAPEIRPQAGPLPRKRGEIGYRESLHTASEGEISHQNAQDDSQLLSRHPADHVPSPASPSSPSSRAAQQTSATPAPNAPPSSPSSSSDRSSMRKGGFGPNFLKAKIGGISITTLIRLGLQLALLGGTIAAWVIITERLGKVNNDSANGDDLPTISGSGSIFIHVTFGIAVLGQLLFLERCVYYMRAQRYAYKHPGAVLPTHNRVGGRSGTGMGFAPWNRPSLPTYAAALQLSGVGTGDVEDSAIAIPPPPAYGNTRGSTLILAGFLRNSLREAIRLENRDSQADDGRSRRSSTQNSLQGRPISYRSTDEEWEERCDAERALRLAETLERLENNSSEPSSSTQPVERT